MALCQRTSWKSEPSLVRAGRGHSENGTISWSPSGNPGALLYPGPNGILVIVLEKLSRYWSVQVQTRTVGYMGESSVHVCIYKYTLMPVHTYAQSPVQSFH